MKVLSSIEIHFLLSDLKGLEGSKISKIYNKGNNHLIFQLHSPKLGKMLLKIVSGIAMYTDHEKEPYDEPSTLCFGLRKNLEGSRLEKIRQIGSERVIEVVLNNRNIKNYLIFEIFSKGNIIVCDNEYKVLLASLYHKWKDREINRHLPYKFPEKEFNVFEIKKEDFENIIKKSSKESVVKALALELGIGGLYAEELCLNTQLDKHLAPNKVNNTQLSLLYDNFKQLINKKIDAQVVFKDGRIIDVIPINLTFYKNFVKKSFKSFSEALAHYFTHAEDLPKKDTKTEAERKKLQEIIKKQEEKIKEMTKAEQEMRKNGEIIYEKYQLINDILKQIQIKLKNTSLKNLKTALKDKKVIKNIDPKEKTITIEI